MNTVQKVVFKISQWIMDNHFSGLLQGEIHE